MATVVLYHITCESKPEGFYSFRRWTSWDTGAQEGRDDGGKEYILPEGRRVGGQLTSDQHIYWDMSTYALPCTLFQYESGAPAIIDRLSSDPLAGVPTGRVHVLVEYNSAAKHLLKQMQVDRRLAYLIGPGSESYNLLTAEVAAVREIPLNEFQYDFERTLRPEKIPSEGDIERIIEGAIEQDRNARNK